MEHATTVSGDEAIDDSCKRRRDGAIADDCCSSRDRDKSEYIEYGPKYKRLSYDNTVVPFEDDDLTQRFIDIVNDNLYQNNFAGCKKFHIKEKVVIFNNDKPITYQKLNSIVNKGPRQTKKNKIPKDWTVIKNHNNGSMFVNLYKQSPTPSINYYDYNIDSTAVSKNVFDFPETSKWLQLHKFENQDRFISDIITVGPWITTRHTDQFNLGGMGLLPSATRTALKVWFFDKNCITEIAECSNKNTHEGNLKKISSLCSDDFGSYIVDEYNKGKLDVIVQMPGDFITITGGYHHSVFTIYDNEISADSDGCAATDSSSSSSNRKKRNVCHLIGFCLPAADIKTSASCYDRGDFDLTDVDIVDKISYVNKQLSKYYSKQSIDEYCKSINSEENKKYSQREELLAKRAVTASTG